MGAWIETDQAIQPYRGIESHPMWVRGLKLSIPTCAKSSCGSHPMWVRGLKLAEATDKDNQQKVAPHVGAWIETLNPLKSLFYATVAPHVGAWIETQMLIKSIVILISRTPCGCVD